MHHKGTPTMGGHDLTVHGSRSFRSITPMEWAAQTHLHTHSEIPGRLRVEPHVLERASCCHFPNEKFVYHINMKNEFLIFIS